MRVLMIGDGLALSTGFSQVLQHIAMALVARGDTVGQIASLDEPPNCDSRPYHALGVRPYFPTGDRVGFGVLEAALSSFAPERIVLCCDPGMAWSWLMRLQAVGNRIPVLLYSPVEGAPVARQFCEAFAAFGVTTVLYTDWAAEQVTAACGIRYPWVWHGVDREVFQPLPADERAAVREALGWTDRFVVAYVGRNCARKSQDRLIEAMAQLKRTLPASLLYLHCAQFDSYWGQGWDLGWLTEQHDVSEFVEFPSKQDALHGEPGVSLARKLAAADLYVHPAQVEGFGLPILEAMASGLPVCTINDGGNMAEIAGDAPLVSVDPYAWQSWFTGARLALTLPDQWARTIHWAHGHPTEMAAARERSLARAADFSWEHMTATLLATLDRAGEAVLEPQEAIG